MAEPEDLTIGEARYADVVVIVAAGRIDQNTAAGFQAHVLESAGAGAVLIDFAGVEYISSVGLRALMIAKKASKAAGGQFAVASLTAVVREVFEISRFNHVLDVYRSVPDALSAMSDAAAQAYGDA